MRDESQCRHLDNLRRCLRGWGSSDVRYQCIDMRSLSVALLETIDGGGVVWEAARRPLEPSPPRSVARGVSTRPFRSPTAVLRETRLSRTASTIRRRSPSRPALPGLAYRLSSRWSSGKTAWPDGDSRVTPHCGGLGAVCSVHCTPSQYRSNTASAASGYQPEGTDGGGCGAG